MKNTIGRVFTAKLDVYEESKYTASIETLDNCQRVEYENVESWEVVSGSRAENEIEQFADGSCIDDLHEYLVLYFANGETATFRNSYVDMFTR